jgi:hypothetical protein
MKKKILFCSFVFCFFSLFASDYDLPNVDSRYIGTYIPVDYENHIKREKKHLWCISNGVSKSS